MSLPSSGSSPSRHIRHCFSCGEGGGSVFLESDIDVVTGKGLSHRTVDGVPATTRTWKVLGKCTSDINVIDHSTWFPAIGCSIHKLQKVTNLHDDAALNQRLSASRRRASNTRLPAVSPISLFSCASFIVLKLPLCLRKLIRVAMFGLSAQLQGLGAVSWFVLASWIGTKVYGCRPD